MKKPKRFGAALAGSCAGIVNGLLGAGGGMVLIPLLGALTDTDEDAVFPSSVCIILPICIVSLCTSWGDGAPTWRTALPYLLGSTAGGIAAGLVKLPTKWLHRLLGVLIIWGGVRYLC